MRTLICIGLILLSGPMVLCQREGPLIPPEPEPPARPEQGLRIVDVLFEDYTGLLHPRFQTTAGMDVVITFRMDGFLREPVKNESGIREEAVRLRYQIDLRDPAGVLVKPAETGNIETILGPRDLEWRPKINWSAAVPPTGPSGDYTVQIRAADDVGKQETSKRVAFRVEGEEVPASDALELAKMEYARSEDGPWSAAGYFSPADHIWARYKIIGYSVSPEKEVWVEQDFAVLTEDGKEIIAQQNAKVERQQSFYQPRFVSTTFNVHLQKPQPASYTLRIHIRDRIGQQSATFESKFVVRP